MRANKLPNYLKTYRKRSGLTQGELAYLLGCQYSSKISRYERSSRLPNPETLFGYEAIFGTSIGRLYAGVYEEVAERTKERAKVLAYINEY